MVDFELIGVDDGSADNTYEIVVSLQYLDNRLSVFKSSGIGKNAAFDMAFQNSNGDAICLFANFA
jgi:glycosyltransferase involved in cell wall biosynthesis